MFGRKIPQIDAKAADDAAERTTSYRTGNEAAPPTVGVKRTTSYTSAMQREQFGFDSIN